MSYAQLLEKLRWQLPADKPVYIGYSGGLDSSLLLKMACEATNGKQVVAIHCNHGVSPNTDRWQKFCEHQASNLNTQLVVEHLRFPDGFSEATGREARYRVFASHMSEGAVLLLGHHADDQAETVLFRLFRGTGIRGLAGIPATRAFASGTLIRPLMDLTRAKIEKIAREQSIDWVEDESNQSDRFDRNYIRLKLLPAVLERWPRAISSIQRATDFLRDDIALLDDFADELLGRVDYRKNEQIDVIADLDLDLLSKLPVRQQSLVLKRFLLKCLGLVPEALNIGEALSQFLDSKADTEPVYALGDNELRRFNSRLFLLPSDRHKLISEQERRWDGRAPLVLENGVLSLTYGAPDEFVVRFRSGGERLKPEGRRHSQTLKKLMQEYRIEPWIRDQIPLIYQGDQLIAVGDRIFCTEHRFEWARK